uniref:Uncharacterized protein n=1 Tax=Sphaerodactylus townsendi TaxID=933632 RepID=A0ACB8EZA6_9SAUR
MVPSPHQQRFGSCNKCIYKSLANTEFCPEFASDFDFVELNLIRIYQYGWCSLKKNFPEASASCTLFQSLFLNIQIISHNSICQVKQVNDIVKWAARLGKCGSAF